jgi:hypothetical protein
VFHGFLRSPEGDMTPVDVPGAGTGTYQGTYAAEFMYSFGGINPAGTITGYIQGEPRSFSGTPFFTDRAAAPECEVRWALASTRESQLLTNEIG